MGIGGVLLAFATIHLGRISKSLRTQLRAGKFIVFDSPSAESFLNCWRQVLPSKNSSPKGVKLFDGTF
jgi:hypothetical protein